MRAGAARAEGTTEQAPRAALAAPISERALIAAVIEADARRANGEDVPDVFTLVDGDSLTGAFSDATSRRVWEILSDRRHRGEPGDLVSTGVALRHALRAENLPFGGKILLASDVMTWLETLVEKIEALASLPSQAEAYAQEIREAADRRERLRTARALAEQLESDLRPLATWYADLAAPLARGTVQNLEPARTPLLVQMSDVHTEKVEWLWYPRLPLGKLCLLGGDPGIGKGFFVAGLVGCITTVGGHCPDGAPSIDGDVILLNAEDGAGDTIRPRLVAAGADLSRVHLLTGYRDESAPDKTQERYITLKDVDVLRDALRLIRPRFVNLDPVQAYLDPKSDMYRPNEVRPFLAALSRLADEYRCTILCSGHLTKGSRDRALYRLLGSIDFVAAARSVLLIGLDPNDPNRRAVAHAKPTAWAPKAPTLAFTIEDNRVLWSAEPCDLTAEALTAPDTAGLQHHTKVADAVTFLEVALSQGPREYRHLLEEAETAGFEKHHLIRASKKLNIISEGGGFPRRTTWRLATLNTAVTATSVTAVTTDSGDGGDTSSSSNRLCDTRAREG